MTFRLLLTLSCSLACVNCNFFENLQPDFQYVQKILLKASYFFDDWDQYGSTNDDCNELPVLSMFSDCDLRFVSSQFNRWMGGSTEVLNKIERRIKMLLRALQSDVEGLQAGVVNTGEISAPDAPSTTTTEATIAPAVNITTTQALTTTSLELACPNPVLFIGWLVNEKPGITMFDLSADGRYKVRSEANTDKKIVTMITDRDNRHLFLSLIEGSVTTYSRDSCDKDYYKIEDTNEMTSMESNSGQFGMALDQTDKYLFTCAYSGSALTVFRVGETGMLKQLTTVKTTDIGVCGLLALNPAKKDLLVVLPAEPYLIVSPLGEKSYLSFYKFDYQNESLTALPFKAKLPSDINAYQFVFSNDGKYIYVVGNKNRVYIFEIKWADNYGDVTKVVQVGSPVVTDDGSRYSDNNIQIHPSGELLFVSNRYPESCIVTFKINISNGQLSKQNFQKNLASFPDRMIINRDGTQLIVAGGGKMEVLNIAKDGQLSEGYFLDGQGVSDSGALYHL